MLDIGWQELFVIAVVAIIVIGPKDMPRVLRAVAGWVRKGRTLAREFQDGVDEMIRQADLEDIKKEVAAATPDQLGKELKDSLDPGGDIARDLDLAAIPSSLEAAVADAGADKGVVKLAPQPETAAALAPSGPAPAPPVDAAPSPAAAAGKPPAPAEEPPPPIAAAGKASG